MTTPRKPISAAMSASTEIAPISANTPRQPIRSETRPAPGEPSRLPSMAADNSRPIATWRRLTGTRSPAMASEVGNTPPAKIPAAIRNASSMEKFTAKGRGRRRR